MNDRFCKMSRSSCKMSGGFRKISRCFYKRSRAIGEMRCSSTTMPLAYVLRYTQRRRVDAAAYRKRVPAGEVLRRLLRAGAAPQRFVVEDRMGTAVDFGDEKRADARIPVEELSHP